MEQKKTIGVLTYTTAHRKMYDLLILLRAKGITNVKVFGIPMHYKKRFKPLIEHRPELIISILSQELCRNLNYMYQEIQSNEEIDLERKGIFLVAGVGILPQWFIKKYRVINANPGYIPNCRGLDALKWAIYNNVLGRSYEIHKRMSPDCEKELLRRFELLKAEKFGGNASNNLSTWLSRKEAA